MSNANATRRAAEGDPDAPTHALENCIDRISTFDGVIGAFVDRDYANARKAAAASARRWDDGLPLSQIDGTTVGIKANIAVAGLSWTAGIGAYRSRVAVADADCVARLRAAGAIIVGSLNMDEAAFGATCDNPHFGRTRNPRRLGFSAGGSSGGAAAAVAAGFCRAALGTDTIGSVRIPASYCGVVGFCPTGRCIGRDGVTPLAPSYDHVGVIARSVAECRLIHSVLAPDADAGVRKTERRIAFLDIAEVNDVDAFVRVAYEAALDSLRTIGFEMHPITLPTDRMIEARRCLLVVVESEGHAQFEALLADPEAEISAHLRGLLDYGARQSAPRIASCREALLAMKAAVRTALDGFAALVTPSTPQASFDFRTRAPKHPAAFTAIGTITGLSSISLPTGIDSSGLPHALQVLCKTDEGALDIAERMSTAFPSFIDPMP